MKSPKISVIMSVYNSEKFLSEAIESILNQTFKDFEFIIINDSSTDNSLEIIKKYQNKDERIVLIENKKNIGLTKSLNIGLKKAKGKYIARMDADDISLPERFQIQYDFLEKNKDIFLVGTGAYNIDTNGKLSTLLRNVSQPSQISKILPQQNCIYHPTIMFRNEKHLYREKFFYTQDYDFYLLLLSEGKQLANIGEPLIKYRINEDAISWTKRSKQKMFKAKAREFYKQRVGFNKDEYEDFLPEEILNIDVEKSTDKLVLGDEVRGSFKINDFERTKQFSKKYFKNHGFLNKITLYYLASFTGKSFSNFLVKIFKL